MAAEDLTGEVILVTRPAHQAEALCELLEHAGAKTIRFPTISIEPITLDPDVYLQLGKADTFDVMIFVSVNAVEQFFAQCPQWQAQASKLAAIGTATCRALQRHGQQVDIMPQAPYNSEALLADSQLIDIEHKRIGIVKGLGGRELLAETLRQRGAKILDLIVYQRTVANVDPQAVIDALAQQQITGVIISSVENMHNLLQLLAPEQDLLLTVPVIAMSENVASAVQQAGFLSDIIVAKEASDQGLKDAVITLHCKH